MSIVAAVCLAVVIWQGALISAKVFYGNTITPYNFLFLSVAAAAFAWIIWLRHVI